MRIRITFHKNENMRFTGHLDLHRAWERTLRRAGLPLAYSQGFHPQPRLNLACALPLGIASQCEVLDAWLDKPLELEDVKAALIKAAPPGITVTKVEEAAPHEPALQTQVLFAEYAISLLDPATDLPERIQRLLQSERIPAERRGKSYDLRPLIAFISPPVADVQGLFHFQARLSACEGATGRPDELLAALGVSIEQARITRTRLIFRQDEQTAAPG